MGKKVTGTKLLELEPLIKMPRTLDGHQMLSAFDLMHSRSVNSVGLIEMEVAPF